MHQSWINYIISVQLPLQLRLQICQLHHNYNYSVLKKSNYNYFRTCNWLQVEITISFKNIITIHADMLECFQKWCQNKLFASFREQHSLNFSRRIQQFFAYFDTSRLPRIHGAAVSYFQQMLLDNGRFYQGKHLLSQLNQQQLIVWTMIDFQVRLDSGIQQLQVSTFYQSRLNLANRPHCQLSELATNN